MSEGSETPRWQARTAILGGAFAASLIVALILVLQAATRQRDRALEVQRASHEAMILARTVDATMGRAEAMLGRFVISGNEGKDLGRRYYDDWRLAGAQLNALERRVSDADSRALINELQRLYRMRGEELADVALRTNYGQNQGALSKFYDAGRSPNVRAMADTLDLLIANEREVLDARTRAAESQIGRTNTLGTLFAMVGVLLVLGGAALAWRVVEAARERQDEEARAQALEAAVGWRTIELSDANDRLRDEMAERAAAEERLRQAQKLEAIGQLTGGIAHDFNNMLSVVIGGLELAKRRALAGGGQVVPHLDQAMEGAVRAAALTRRLLSFARAEPLAATPTEAGALIADMAELLDRVIGDTIRVRIEAQEHGAILVDRHQLENAILNLSVNARDAMPDGGTLTIEVANRRVVEGELHEVPGGEYVAISVTDTGTGMTPEVRARIFEPFFTTKAVNEGTGLGLSQIFGFVKQSGGAVEVETEVGRGTRVTLLLPRQQALPVDNVASLSSPAAASRDYRVVLVIEDDPRVLAATVATLEELGHVAVACAGPGLALDLLDARPDIDLIVSDVMMPDLTGPQLVTAIHARHPGLPVLFVTGFAGDETEESFEGFQVLRKPFTMLQLEAAVAAAPRYAPLPEAA